MDIAITMFVTHKSIDIITLARKAEALEALEQLADKIQLGA